MLLHMLMLLSISMISSHHLIKDRIIEHVHQRAGAVHIPVSLLCKHRHWHIVFHVLRTNASITISTHLIASTSLYISWIFLANLPMIVHQRFREFSLTVTALHLTMLTFVRMSVEFKKALHVPAKWTGYFLLRLIVQVRICFFSASVYFAHILLFTHTWIRVFWALVVLLSCEYLFSMLFLLFLWLAMLVIWIFRNPAGSKLWISLTSAFMN